MGSQAKVLAILNGRKSEIRAHLDSETLQLLGTPKIILSLTGIRAVPQGNWLVIRAQQETIKLHLGVAMAALWAKKISNPPSLASKLGLKPMSTVWLSGDTTPEIAAAIREVGAEAFSRGKLSGKRVDLVFIDYRGAKDESRFRSVIPLLNEANAVWVIFRKGPSGPGETNITTAGRRSGLRDTKVAKISSTRIGLRFVIPRT